jgi:hypothetical protein
VHGWGNARGWAFIYLVIYIVAFAWDIGNLVAVLSGHGRYPASSAVNGSICVLLNTIVIFILRDELQELPLRRPLGVVMTLFFGSFYFQHALTQLSHLRSTTDTQDALAAAK